VLVPFGPLIAVVVAGSFFRNSDGSGEQAYGLLIMGGIGWFICSLIVVPALLFRAESPPGSSEDDDGDGGGGPQEPSSGDPGPAGIPLLDAEQSSERIRDHVRRKRPWPGRRTAREPERTSSPEHP
jgi:hypothetical protein